MIYLRGEKLDETDCDIIIHECFCKKTEKDIVNEYIFSKFDVAKRAHEEYSGVDIEKVKTMKLTVDEKSKKIIINVYTKLNKKLNKEKTMRKINQTNYEETIEQFFKMMKSVKTRKPDVKIGLMNLTEDDGRDTMKIWSTLMEKSKEHDIDIHILDV